jgi:hypothetical protein
VAGSVLSWGWAGALDGGTGMCERGMRSGVVLNDVEILLRECFLLARLCCCAGARRA